MSDTVSTLAKEEIEAFRAALRKRAAAKRHLNAARLEKARELARRAARLLKDEFGAAKVVVFGPLARSHLFHHRSDIDMAVWGLSGRAYYRAVGVLQSLDSTIPIDLIAFEDASEALQEVILREGEEL